MYFQIQEGFSPINLKDIEKDKLTLGIIPLEELEHCYKKFNFSNSTVTECQNVTYQIHGAIDVHNDYLFGIITGINERQIIKVQDRFGIYVKHNLFLIVIIEDKDESIKAKVFETLEHLNYSNITLERLIYGFLERLISDDYGMLEKIEAEISEYEDKINASNLDKNFNFEITRIRKKLLLLDNYYEQLIVIGEELEANDIDLFEEEKLHYFKIFTDRVTRLSYNTRMLQDFSVHIREAYHSQLDNNLNSIMKIFTVVTTIFLPLTLIVGWYGMNFTHMPELTWSYGYLYVLILSILVAIFCIFYFKKKKFI